MRLCVANVFLTCCYSDGFLYAGGHNTYGQLGFPGEAQVPIPRRVPAFTNRPVAAVACGQHHSLAVTDWGDVYAWGRGSGSS